MNPRPCAQCGKIYQPVGNAPSRRFCTRQCFNEYRMRRISRICEECGGEFQARESEIARGGGKYCTRACWRKNAGLTDEQYAANADKMSVARRGAANPAYKHGRDGNRARLKYFSLALKGESSCRNCGSSDLLQLHHAIPRSMSAAARDEILNGVPLCVRCHMSWHRRGKVTLYRDIFTVEEWNYLCSVELVGQLTAAWLDDRYPPRPGLVGIEEARRRTTKAA